MFHYLRSILCLYSLQDLVIRKNPGEKLGISIRGGTANQFGNPFDKTDEGIFISRVCCFVLSLWCGFRSVDDCQHESSVHCLHALHRCCQCIRSVCPSHLSLAIDDFVSWASVTVYLMAPPRCGRYCITVATCVIIDTYFHGRLQFFIYHFFICFIITLIDFLCTTIAITIPSVCLSVTLVIHVEMV